MADKPTNVDPTTMKFLGKEMYLVVTRPVRSPEIAKRLADHLAHQVDLEKRGIMRASFEFEDRIGGLACAGLS